MSKAKRCWAPDDDDEEDVAVAGRYDDDDALGRPRDLRPRSQGGDRLAAAAPRGHRPDPEEEEVVGVRGPKRPRAEYQPHATASYGRQGGWAGSGGGRPGGRPDPDPGSGSRQAVGGRRRDDLSEDPDLDLDPEPGADVGRGQGPRGPAVPDSRLGGVGARGVEGGGAYGREGGQGGGGAHRGGDERGGRGVGYPEPRGGEGDRWGDKGVEAGVGRWGDGAGAGGEGRWGDRGDEPLPVGPARAAVGRGQGGFTGREAGGSRGRDPGGYGDMERDRGRDREDDGGDRGRVNKGRGGEDDDGDRGRDDLGRDRAGIRAREEDRGGGIWAATQAGAEAAAAGKGAWARRWGGRPVLRTMLAEGQGRVRRRGRSGGAAGARVWRTSRTSS